MWYFIAYIHTLLCPLPFLLSNPPAASDINKDVVYTSFCPITHECHFEEKNLFKLCPHTSHLTKSPQHLFNPTKVPNKYTNRDKKESTKQSQVAAILLSNEKEPVIDYDNLNGSQEHHAQ